MRTEKEIRELFDKVFDETMKENPTVVGYMNARYTPKDRRRVLAGVLKGLNYALGSDTKIFPDITSS